MSIKERLDSLREKAKSKIKPESTQEEIDEANSIIAELDAIETEHNEVLSTSAKYKDTIVNMVLKNGDGKAPVDDSEGSKPKSMDEFLTDFEKEHKEG